LVRHRDGTGTDQSYPVRGLGLWRGAYAIRSSKGSH
jgi:hypothetical protein